MFLMQAATIPSNLPNNIDMSSFGGSALGSMFAVFGIFILILVIISIIICVLSLMDIYHWGMTDKAAFDRVGESKKKWFMNLVLMPIIAGVIMIIPFIGWVIGAIIYIYFLVMVLVYFFATRKKVGTGA
ncbi:MAG: hypothetical protein WCV92_02720 [Candidatus Buchananbacteria bacterium]